MALHEEKWIPEPNSGCWLWIASVNNDGYGFFGMGGRTMSAHRASWILHRGAIPKGKYVLHKCDVRQCVNPDHLYLGTQFDNMRDASIRGGLSRASYCGKKTHCPRGHEYTADNTYRQPRVSGKGYGRVCRECRGIGSARPGLLRGTDIACGRGHAYTPENTYIFRGSRACRRCNTIAVARYKAKRALAEPTP